MKTARALAALALTGLIACANAAGPVASGGPSDAPTGSSAQLEPSASSTAPTGTLTVAGGATITIPTDAPTGSGSTAAPTAPPATTATGTPPPTADKRKWAPLEVSLSATCVQRGDTFTVSATSLPDSNLTFVIGYSRTEDGEKYVPDFMMFDHKANPTGTIDWNVVIRPDTPFGPAVVKVVTSTTDGRGAFVEMHIKVAESC